MACNPFERLFRILITPEYLPAMKRRRSSDPQGKEVYLTLPVHCSHFIVKQIVILLRKKRKDL